MYMFRYPTIRPSYHLTTRGFTLVEVVVGMTVFSIGLTAIFALLSTTMTSASYARHETVVAGLLREQMELVKNLRDTNLKNYARWDTIATWALVPGYLEGGIYTIQNDYTSWETKYDTNGIITYSPVSLKSKVLPSDDIEKFTTARLTLDAQGRYTHDQTGTPTPYASYIIVSPLGYTGATGNFTPVQKDSKNQGYIIDARVIVKNWNNYREYDAKTAITDWVR